MATILKSRPRILEGAGYASLRERVTETLLEGRRKIEQQKVLTYWETGRHIHEHLLAHQDRAEYRAKVVEKLAGDLEVSDKLLYQCLQGYRAFKNFYARRNSFPNLTWAHYRAAMRVPDEEQRLRLLDQAAKNEWVSRDLEIEVRNHRWTERVSGSVGKKPAPLPFVCLGPFYTYPIIRPETIHSRANDLLVDLGFGHTLELGAVTGKHFPEGTIVTSSRDAKSRYVLEKIPARNTGPGAESILYTYKAFVEKVLDGDTLKVEFDLGFGCRKRETIRLNHIDCPELDKPEGKTAKRLVESLLAPCEFITVKSVKTRKEKWGRYLGDVFIPAPSAPEGRRPATQARGPVYLNQLLVDRGRAVRIQS